MCGHGIELSCTWPSGDLWEGVKKEARFCVACVVCLWSFSISTDKVTISAGYAEYRSMMISKNLPCFETGQVFE